MPPCTEYGVMLCTLYSLYNIWKPSESLLNIDMALWRYVMYSDGLLFIFVNVVLYVHN